MIMAVLFDLGGTLIKTAAVPEIMKRILHAYKIQKPLSEITLACKEVDNQLTLEDYTLSYDEFWTEWNMRILRRLQIDGNLKPLAEAITERWWDYADVRLYPDVKVTLRGLRSKGFKLGLVSNGFIRDIDEVFRRTGLTGIFDVAVGVDIVKKPKPNREIFLYALEKIKVSPSEALFVGDNLEMDYEGARKAGLNVLLIDRDNKVKGMVKKISSLMEITLYL